MQDGHGNQGSAAPAYFDAESVGIATFLGTPIAGAILHASNKWTAQMPMGAVFSVLSGVIATAVLFAIGAVVPASLRMVASLISVAVVVATRSIARSWLEENRVDEAVRYQQARYRSRALVALACAPISVLLVAAVIYSEVIPPNRSREITPEYRTLAVNPTNEVQYANDVTEATARTVADVLVREGMLSQTGEHNVQLARRSGALVLRIPVNPAINEVQMGGLKLITRIVAGALDPRAPMLLELTDAQWTSMHSFNVWPLRSIDVAPTAAILATPEVTNEEVGRVGAWLNEEGFFLPGLKKRLMMDRTSDGLTLLIPIAAAQVTEAIDAELRAMAPRFAARMSLETAVIQLTSAEFVAHTTMRGAAAQAAARPR